MLPGTQYLGERSSFFPLLEQAACKQKNLWVLHSWKKSGETKGFSIIFADTPSLLIDVHSMVSHDLERDAKVD